MCAPERLTGLRRAAAVQAGYGLEASGPIPMNSTLCFDATVLSVGTKPAVPASPPARRIMVTFSEPGAGPAASSDDDEACSTPDAPDSAEAHGTPYGCFAPA